MPPLAVTPTPVRQPGGGGGTSSDRRVEKVTTRRLDEEDIHPYVITSELGKGSFAIVYRGYNEVNMLPSLSFIQDTVLWTSLTYTYLVIIEDERAGCDQDC